MDDVVRMAQCPQHGRVIVTLERLREPPITRAYHVKRDGRVHAFRTKSWDVRGVRTLPIVAHGRNAPE